MAKSEPNKPRGESEPKNEAREVEKRGAVENQDSVAPDDYPQDDGGRPDYGSPKRKD